MSINRAVRWTCVLVVLFLGVAARADAAIGPQLGDAPQAIFVPDQGHARVNVVSGNLLLTETDLADAKSTYHVAYGRSYNSLSSTDSLLGKRWNLSVGPDVRITTATDRVTVSGPTGEQLDFVAKADGSFSSPDGFDGYLAQSNGTYVLTRSDRSSQTFDSQGNEIAATDANGRNFTIQNTSAAGKTVLSSYGTADGRRINVSYNGDSRIREIDDPASGHRYYSYTNGLLTAYSGPSASSTYTYDANGHLATATYSDGSSYLVDALPDGRTHSLTIRASGQADQTYTFDYGDMQTTVTNPDGSTDTYAYDANGNALEDPEVLNAAAQAYATDYNTDLATARTWMINQDRSGALGEQIATTSIRDGYAGYWYDDQTRRIHLNLVTGTDTAPAQQILQDDGVSALSEIDFVDDTQDAIDHGVDTLTTGLHDAITAGHIRVSRDSEGNRVLVELAGDATASERNDARTQAAQLNVKTAVVDGELPSYAAENADCASRSVSSKDGLGLACEAPIRGGTRIDQPHGDDATFCSAGFTARSKTDNNEYLLTAGHCFDDSSEPWLLRQPTGPDVPIGPTYRGVHGEQGDASLISITNPALNPSGFPQVVFNRDTRLTNGRETRYAIVRSSFSKKGQYICETGATTGSHCGKILAENLADVAEGTLVRHLALANVCVGPGDSGGSVIRGRSAVGLIAQRVTGEVNGRKFCVSLFQGAKTAEDLLNVNIVALADVPPLSPTPGG